VHLGELAPSSYLREGLGCRLAISEGPAAQHAMGIAVAIDDEHAHEPAAIQKAGGDDPVEF
jgi:hypothetical protein